MPSIKIDNLYSEESFIRYCQGDRFESTKLGKRVTVEFLRAAEEDGLIVPLLVQNETRKTKEGEEEVEVKYYSPFQIFLVAALIENSIDDGVLRSPHNGEWQKEQGTRFIDWGGGHQFNADIYEQKRGAEPEFNHNALTIADDFHKILRFIHSLDPEETSQRMYEKRRLHDGAPLLTYDLTPLEQGGKSFLEQHDLDMNRIKRVLVSVGFIATKLDPLEHWFYYVKKHSQFRKDKLKGMALVAQDLYGFCDIVYDIVDISYNEKLPPFFELLHPDIKPYSMERPEHASGHDLKAIQSALSKLRQWVSDHQVLLAELEPAIMHDNVKAMLAECEVQLNDFEQRYGDRRYVGSRRVHRADSVKIDQLDSGTKAMVEQMGRQSVRMEEEDKGRKLSEDEKTEVISHKIAFSIDRRLDDLGRSVSGVAYKIAQAMWPIHHRAEKEKEMSQGPAMEEFRKSVPKSDPEYARKHHEFWNTGMKEYQKPHQEKMDTIRSEQDSLHSIGGLTRLVFCAACRANLVQKHYSHNDSQITEEAVCDACFGFEAEKVMLGTDDDRKNTKYAEWHCDGCDQLLLKFAVGNVIAARTMNKTSMQVVLEYGHAKVEAKCPNIKCGHINHRPLDWGWTF